jgi:hypothetical protein
MQDLEIRIVTEIYTLNKKIQAQDKLNIDLHKYLDNLMSIGPKNNSLELIPLLTKILIKGPI